MRLKRSNISLISNVLELEYGSPRLGNKKNPLNELLYILLSLRTTGPSFERVYCEFKKTYPRWEDTYRSSVRKIEKTIYNAGLASQKAKNLKAILSKIQKDFGFVTLSPLKALGDSEIEHYLCSLPGIGKKSARCIMLYSFDRQVFPVDAHCFRIVKRLGWIRKDLNNNEKNADIIQEFIPSALRYSLHVNMVAHGRAICGERYPKCSICPIRKYCKYRPK